MSDDDDAAGPVPGPHGQGSAPGADRPDADAPGPVADRAPGTGPAQEPPGAETEPATPPVPAAPAEAGGRHRVRRHSSQDGARDGAKDGAVATAHRGSFWKELPVLLVIALALALLIKAFLVQAFYIPSGSMEQTLRINDRVLVNKLVYDFRDIKRGEIVVFDANGSLARDQDARVIAEPGNPVSKALNKITTTLGFGVPPGEQDYIKRVIGIPGDRVMCCDANERIVITPEGRSPVALDEPYVFENDTPQRFCEAGIDDTTCPPGATGVLVPEGRLFVMGDHRSESSDSRLKYVSYFNGGATNDGFNGTVSEDLVIGRAFVTVWPLGHLDWLSVPDLFEDQVDSMAAAPYALGGLAVLPLAWVRRRRRRREQPA